MTHHKTLRPAMLCSLLISASTMVGAEEFFVDVGGGNNSFSPSFLTINVGDTVTWTNRGGNHNVRSIGDFFGEFSSGTASTAPWTYSYTFESPGVRNYDCVVHQPFMRGAIEVVQEGMPNDFLINSGLTGAWYEPATAGQGVFIEIVPSSEQAFAAWFTFDDGTPAKAIGAPEQRWFTAFGSYSGAVIDMDVTVTGDGVFDQEDAVSNSEPGSIGSLEVEFFSCTEAIARYDLTAYGLSGEINLERLLPDVNCADLAAQ